MTSENCKLTCWIVSIIVCFLVVYCSIAGTFIATGQTKQNGIATLNGTFTAINWCKSSCESDFEFGTWCNQDFEASAEWNFDNTTYFTYNKTLNWRSDSLNCSVIKANSSLSVMIEKDKPNVPYSLEPYGSVYYSGLSMFGNGMFSVLASIAVIGVISCFFTFIFECCCKRKDYEIM